MAAILDIGHRLITGSLVLASVASGAAVVYGIVSLYVIRPEEQRAGAIYRAKQAAGSATAAAAVAPSAGAAGDAPAADGTSVAPLK